MKTILAVMAIAATSLFAQSPAFEVATIKPNPGPLRISLVPRIKNGRFLATNMTPKRLLADAFGVADSRIIGPEWLDKDYYDILAKSPESVPDGEMKAMLQALILERFKIAFHREPRTLDAYHLVVAKGGVKMPAYPARERPQPDPKVRYSVVGVMTLTEFAGFMARVVGRPVIDKTELTGRYEFLLAFAPLSPQPADTIAEFGPPDIFTAVQEQLGLKLVAGKDDLDVIVIDKIARTPTEN